MTQRCDRASEAILIAMACLSPWAFGAVEAWAELGLEIGVVLLAVLWAWGGRRTDRGRALYCAPSLALAGLVVLALFQATSLPGGVLRVFSPATATLRASLIPPAAERVAGDPGQVVSLASATLSQNPEATFHVAAWLAAVWIVFQAVAGLADGRGALRRFSWFVAANATVVALYSMFQALFWNGKIYGWRSSPYGSAGPFVSHNHLAAYLNLGLGLALGFLAAGSRTEILQQSRGRRLWAAYAAGLIVAGIVISLSRSGFLGLLAAAVGLYLMVWPRGMRTWLALGALAALIVVFLLVIGQAAPYQARLATLLKSSSYAERLQIWRDALRAWPTYPIWGMGLGSFEAAAAPWFSQAADVKYTHAENEYVEWLVEGGLVGVGLMVAALVGVVRLALQGWHASSQSQDRALMLGGACCGIGLLVQSGGGFAPHIPAIGLTAVILAALLAKVGLESLPPSRRDWPWVRGVRPLMVELIVVAIAGVIVVHGASWARAEAAFLTAGLGLHDNDLLARGRNRLKSEGASHFDSPELIRLQGALEQALRMRPNWAEGHLRLGLIHLHGYEVAAAESLAASVADPVAREVFASPLWLHDVIHSTPLAQRQPTTELIGFEPIARCLIPAARCFLEARRCSPVLALPHAELAAVDFLLEGGDPGWVYVERALRLAGAQAPLIALATQLAVQLESTELAAGGLRRSLLTHAMDWKQVADLAAEVLPPERILRDVATDCRLALLFSDRLFATSEDRETRLRFLGTALARLPHDPELSPGERLELEAQIRDRLDQPQRARALLEAALALEPTRAAWRKDLVLWLIARGSLREAHEQATIGLHLTPREPEAQQALDLAAEALARGKLWARPRDIDKPTFD
jgi:O-antigen ligase